MQSRKADVVAEIEACPSEEGYPRSFELYEEYSGRDIGETVIFRIKKFAKATVDEKRIMSASVEDEVSGFCFWLEETKGIEPSVARYCSVSLKSLLLGLPMGMQIALLFDEVLHTNPE